MRRMMRIVAPLSQTAWALIKVIFYVHNVQYVGVNDRNRFGVHEETHAGFGIHCRKCEEIRQRPHTGSLDWFPIGAIITAMALALVAEFVGTRLF